MRAALRVDGLAVDRDRRRVLRDVGFTAAPGEVVAIVGPNGAGKSTLLEALAGLQPATGTVTFDGRVLAGVRDRARVFGYMPDEIVLPDEMPLSRALRLDPEDPVVETFGVAGLLGRHGSALSRGEAKRCQLAAVVAAARPVLLLDEPFGAFDPRQLRDVMPVVRAMTRERVVIVTIHQMRTAELFADRVVLLASGSVLASGTIAELRASTELPDAALDDVVLALLDRGVA